MAKIRTQNKIAELALAINAKARELQNVTESKDVALKEVRELGERKLKLSKEIDGLAKKIEEKRRELEEVIEKKRSFSETIEKEIKGRKKISADLSSEISAKEKELAETGHLLLERNEFLKKTAAARADFLEWSGKLEKVEHEYRKLLPQIEAEKREHSTKARELESYEGYLRDFYGKVASYVRTAKATLEYVDKALEEKLPIYFTPPKEPLTMDNFNSFIKI